MAVTLVVRSAAGAADDRPAHPASISFDLPRVVLGRGEGCDLRLPDLSVSHRHASIRQRGADYILVDEASTNGTYVGSARLHPQSPRVLRNGELIRLGRVWVEVRIEHAVPTAQPALATRDLALQLVAQALAAQGERGAPRLVVDEGPDAGKQLDLDGPARPFVIGRGREADLMIDVADASRRHVQVVRRGDQLLVRDLGSRNGTIVGESPIPMDRDTVLRPGGSLGIGPDKIRFEHAAIDALRELERADDEPFDPRELPPPPSSHEPGTGPGGSDPLDTSTARERDVEGEPPALAPESAGRERRERREPAAGWGKTDVLVVLLALAVLALSGVGLYWLFRG
jgi:pSer/pThr/pTyr-binding forkhead associated (FHA) protein